MHENVQAAIQGLSPFEYESSQCRAIKLRNKTVSLGDPVKPLFGFGPLQKVPSAASGFYLLKQGWLNEDNGLLFLK